MRLPNPWLMHYWMTEKCLSKMLDNENYELISLFALPAQTKDTTLPRLIRKMADRPIYRNARMQGNPLTLAIMVCSS
mgnify:FL=1